jgi:hypothetical protein
MKIGLIDVDGHNFPNLALMKISKYHKNKGHDVEFVTIGNYDKVYMSKVFTFTNDYNYRFFNCDEIIKGGTGYNKTNILPEEIEHIMPDYSLYDENKAFGFLTRGCPNKCNFCIVPNKEGNITENADISEFWNGQKSAILLDNNVLAHEHGLKQIEKIINLGIKIDFNQGLDARIIAKNKDIAKLLSRVKWHKPLRMACDSKKQMIYIKKATELLRKYNTTPKNYFIYLLVKDIGDAYERAVFLKELKLDPFAQPFRDLENNIQPTKEQQKFSRWVNHKAIFKTVDFEDYK